LRRYLVVLEYDGTQFHGSQVQRLQRTVQGEVEAALERLDGAPVRTVFAGRTDAGVHAQGQVVGFDLGRERNPAELAAALSGLMPGDVAAKAAAVVPAGFSPRYWAEARRYRYRLLLARGRAPLRERYAFRVGAEIDPEPMRKAAERYRGQHDFGAFGRPPQGTSTVRTLTRLDLEVRDDALDVVVEGDAFLRRMVRRLIGTLVDVGRGRTDWREAASAVDDPQNNAVGPALPAQGLTLEGVAYGRERLGLGTGRWWSSEPLVAGTDVTLARGVRK